ncbi:MAG TPA: M28 family peptidase [Candidatus Kryptonia bacterium]|nr:M28 family peptidase [Candidatus Kryptonia bacterium]
MSFDEIFDALLRPRENGSAALAEVASYLERTLRATGATVTLHEFVCRPYAGRIAGVVCLLLAVIFFVLMWRRRFAGALLVALVLPAYLLMDYELRFPLLSRIGSVVEHNIVATFPVSRPQRRVIVSAHYDSKTDLLDHQQRAPVEFLVGPFVLFTSGLPLTALWRRWRRRSERHVRAWAIVAPVYFAGVCAVLSGGAMVHARSPGALDDGAAVATLLQLAHRLGAGAPQLDHTEVDIVLFAGEEVGLQGSARYVAERFTPRPTVPTYVINAEGWGFGPLLSYFTSDRSVLKRYDASTPLVRALDRVYRKVTHGVGLAPDVQPLTSDARSFLAAGIPSVTLSSQGSGEDRLRGLHSAADSRDRIQPAALDQTLEFLQAALVDIDTRGVE